MADGDTRMFHELCSHIYKAVSVSLCLFELKNLKYLLLLDKGFGLTRDSLPSVHSCSFGL
jgi:hypothetical protein